MSRSEILQKALELPSLEREVLAHDLLESLDPPGPDLEAAWNEELERRAAAYERGEEEAVDLEVFREELQRCLKEAGPGR